MPTPHGPNVSTSSMKNGHISYKGGNGPFKYDPKEVRAWLAQRYGEVKHPEPATPAEKKS